MEVRRVLCQGYRPTRSSAAIKWPRGPRARHLSGLCPHQCNDGVAGPRQVLIIMCRDQDRRRAHLMHLRLLNFVVTGFWRFVSSVEGYGKQRHPRVPNPTTKARAATAAAQPAVLG